MVNKYTVKMLPKAYRDIDNIYGYISRQIKEDAAARRLVDKFESEVLGLSMLPYRGAERKVGAYAKKGYRQLFVDNFTVIYRINEEHKEVIIVTVRYSPGKF